MKSIDKLLYDILVQRRNVVLPGVGTLESKRRKAKRISETEIIPPQNVVVFSPEEAEGTETVVSLIAADRNIPLDEAAARYGSWLECARRADGSILVDDAGEVQDGKFVVAPELHAALNPDGEEVITIKARKRGIPAWVWIAIVIVVALAAFFALRHCKPGLFCGNSTAPTTATVATATPEPAADSLAAAPPVSAAPATPAASTASATTPSTPAGRFHVVAGAFAVEGNADKFAAQVKREHPHLAGPDRARGEKQDELLLGYKPFTLDLRAKMICRGIFCVMLETRILTYA